MTEEFYIALYIWTGFKLIEDRRGLDMGEKVVLVALWLPILVICWICDFIGFWFE